MVLYNFKTITVVPKSSDLIDVILSKTQRKTPTVVHKGYQISRIREFYTRKVKFTAQNYHDKLHLIVSEFPKLDDIHPFYADLINILYSRDHYKLALGQINTAKRLIDNIGADYVRLLKYGDSLYRCKQLKRAALGRMCTLMKKLNASLCYLEQVRQHLSRLPSIDPNTRTLLITGFPNVGKSSFINKITRANVEVQPYAFTTKSLFVGHTDHNYLRWQVIDTPGILDHPLEEQNTIEMQAVTALAHLNACILFFVDISETCGYTIAQQVSLYNNIKPLFVNKPLLIVANKTDLKKLEALDAEDRALLDSISSQQNNVMITMSNVSEEGVFNVKNNACELLLAQRVENKMKTKRSQDILARIHVAIPEPRDNKKRLPSIPQSVLNARSQMVDDTQEKPPRITEKDIELQNGGPGVYNHDFRKHFQLANDEWKFDAIPEIIDNTNVADWIDPDIDRRLEELEREEEELERKALEDVDMDSDLDEETRQTVAAIKDKKKQIITDNVLKKTSRSVIPRKFKKANIEDFERHVKEVGLDPTQARETMLERARSRSRGRTRERDSSVSRPKSQSRPRSQSVARPSAETRSFSTISQRKEAKKKTRLVQKFGNQQARAGESDRRIPTEKPRHLFSGKRGIGKTDRR